LLERYGIKTRTSNGLGYGEGSRTPSCRQCFEERNEHKPFRDVQPSTTFFIDINPMHEIWAKILHQPFKNSAEDINFFCGVHYLSFVLRPCNETNGTLEMIHDFLTNGDP